MNSLSRRFPAVARNLLGLVFFVFGLNGFLHFIPQPPMEGPAGDFIGALVASGFVMLLVKGVEVAAGLMLLTNRFVPLALTLLAPVIVVIVGFHTILAPAGAPMALFVLALELTLAWAYREAFAPMLRAQHEPTQTSIAESARHAHAH